MQSQQLSTLRRLSWKIQHMKKTSRSKSADNPDENIKLKMFHAEIINDAGKLNDDVSKYKDIPVVTNVSPATGAGQLLPGEDGGEAFDWRGSRAIKGNANLTYYFSHDEKKLFFHHH